MSHCLKCLQTTVHCMLFLIYPIPLDKSMSPPVRLMAALITFPLYVPPG